MTNTTTKDFIKLYLTKPHQNMLQIILFREEDNRSLSRGPVHSIDFRLNRWYSMFVDSYLVKEKKMIDFADFNIKLIIGFSLMMIVVLLTYIAYKLSEKKTFKKSSSVSHNIKKS